MNTHRNQQPTGEALVFEQREFRTSREAIEFAQTTPGLTAIRLEGRPLVVSRTAAERLELAEVSFAYLHERNGVVMTVPVKDRGE